LEIFIEKFGKGDIFVKKFFYDYYTETDICGMYTLPHFIVLFLFFGLLALFVYKSRRLTDKQWNKIHFWIAVGVLVCEVVKIAIRVYKNQPPDDWIPLFYCSLFVFAVWFALCKWQPLKRLGYAYMTMGGVAAATFYIVYPSTGLNIYPWWHPAPLHGILFHFVMCYTGLTALINKRFTPTIKDGLYYSIFIIAACVPSYFFNERFGSNCMFLRDAFGLPFLDGLLKWSHPAYMVVVALAQSVGMYALNYGIYRLAIKIKGGKKV
jgi:hypothetical protein